jgi:hypothetical protein
MWGCDGRLFGLALPLDSAWRVGAEMGAQKLGKQIFKTFRLHPFWCYG